MRVPKFALIWLLICLGLALLDPSPVFIHRRDFDRAADTWRQNPTQENEEALRVQQRKNAVIRNEVRILEAFVLFAAGSLCYGAFRAIRSGLRGRKTS
jgi:hypothetical protein